MELDILQASENLVKYQHETTKWRDKKVVNKNITVGDWVLKRKSNAETSGKLHSKGGRAILGNQKQQARVIPPV